ncbi:NitT/TauT family transport system substrate-binding protein [Neorhizobium sp. 2083]|uniref:ABC transporter substrate-binding protein n=1 Tax=Neorhizobium sp. 2083 TaxID=2817762 RepID=UPI00285A065B|nr:ABC transporter substrate-binding protein [Neorhizobium sp. 2083]MDR6820343.1 NitT/TauT family transport system substrate-binding protein [Neorhizobium sp. 2083]
MLKRAILIASVAMAGAAPSWAQTRIAVGTPPIAEVEAAFVAKDEGMFEKNGLNVEFLPTGSNQTLVAALVAGSHQIVAVSPTVLLQAVDSGIDLVVVANCGVTAPRTATNVGLAVRGGVEISKPEDIKGKKVGTPSIGGTLDILFRQWLKQKNVPEKSITFIEVPIPNTADVLKGGTIDAIIAGEPSLGRAVSQSNGKVAFNYMSEIPENLPYTTFVATREWAKANAGTIKSFRTAFAEAVGYVAANQGKTREIVSKYTRLPVEVLNKIELPECKTVPSKAALDYFDKAMREGGMLTGKIDTAGLIAP